MTQDKIVAVGLLTKRDLDVLGIGFGRAFRVPDDDAFADLLRALDALPANANSIKADRS